MTRHRIVQDRRPTALLRLRRRSAVAISTLYVASLGCAAAAPSPYDVWVFTAANVLLPAGFGWLLHVHNLRRRVIREASFLLCRRCEYPLHGLPPSGSCPECGLAYEADEVRQAWRGDAPGAATKSD